MIYVQPFEGFHLNWFTLSFYLDLMLLCPYVLISTLLAPLAIRILEFRPQIYSSTINKYMPLSSTWFSSSLLNFSLSQFYACSSSDGLWFFYGCSIYINKFYGIDGIPSSNLYIQEPYESQDHYIIQDMRPHYLYLVRIRSFNPSKYHYKFWTSDASLLCIVVHGIDECARLK